MNKLVCKATTGQYKRPEKTDKEKEEILITVTKQYRQALRGGLINCADCGQERPLSKIYKCFFCGRYYCPVCARWHFT